MRLGWSQLGGGMIAIIIVFAIIAALVVANLAYEHRQHAALSQAQPATGHYDVKNEERVGRKSLKRVKRGQITQPRPENYAKVRDGDECYAQYEDHMNDAAACRNSVHPRKTRYYG